MFASKRARGFRPVRAVVATTGSAALMFGVVFAGSSAAAENQDDYEAMQRACGEGSLCIWDGPNGDGARMDLYRCEIVDVHKPYAGQDPIAGVGSFVNNQTDGTTASFSGPLPEDPEGPPQHQYDSTAFDIRGDTTDLNTFIVETC